jgi:hypothetical protein
MSKLLNSITIATGLTLAWCSPSIESNHGFHIVVSDITIDGTKEKAMLIIDKHGNVQCTKNFERLPVVSKVNPAKHESFQQSEWNPLWQMNSTGIQMTRTPDGLYTNLRNKYGDMIMQVINKNWNGTRVFTTIDEFNYYKTKCDTL